MPSPEERYVKLTTKRRADGKLVYLPARPASVKPSPSTDVVLYANEADRMDVIAHNVYGSAEYWWKIAAANQQVNGSVSIRPGTKLLIPRVF